MCALGAAPDLAAQAKVPVVLNHLVITVDSATYRDVRNSAFLSHDFAAVDSVPNAIFPGLGPKLIGKYNFLVIEGAGAGRVVEAGDVGIVFGVEQVGRIEALGQLTGMRSDVQTSRNEFAKVPVYAGNGAKVLDFLPRDSISSHTQFRIQQYSEVTAQQLARTDSLPLNDASNARFLAGAFDPRRLFSYVSGATLAIPAGDIAKIVAVLKRDNVPIVAEGEGAIIKLDGFTLHLIPSWNGAGVKQLQFALTRAAVANPTYRFGPKSQLRFGPGLIAVWDFENKR